MRSKDGELKPSVPPYTESVVLALNEIQIGGDITSMAVFFRQAGETHMVGVGLSPGGL